MWDFKLKNKIKSIQFSTPFTSARLSPDGNVIAYGLGNDWHKGLDSLGKYSPSVGCYVVPNHELNYTPS